MTISFGMRLNDFLERQPLGWILLEALLLLGLIGYLDYCLPYEVTLLMFYFGPIFFAAWYGNRHLAVVLALAASAVWWAANLNSPPYSWQAHSWAAFNRVIFFLIMALGGAAMRSERETMRARVLALERTRELEEEILRVSEREQMRIGLDLHDGLCQHLAAIDCAVACLRQDLEEHDRAEASAAGFIQTQLNRAIRDARDLARGIFPVQIDEEGFLAALEELVSTTNRLRQTSARLDVEGDIRIKDPQVGMHLFRIAQEALSNVSKHAKAEQVIIRLKRADGELVMAIIDNGVGLDRSTDGRGLGMQTMRYRAKALGAKLTIEKGKEGGAVVRCTLPLPKQEVS